MAPSLGLRFVPADSTTKGAVCLAWRVTAPSAESRKSDDAADRWRRAHPEQGMAALISSTCAFQVAAIAGVMPVKERVA